MERGKYYIAEISLFRGNPNFRCVIYARSKNIFIIFNVNDLNNYYMGNMNDFKIIKEIELY